LIKINHKKLFILKNNPISKVYCGFFHSFVVSKSNKIFCLGRNNFGQLGLNDNENRLIPEENKYFKRKTIIQCSLGGYHSIILIEKPKTKKLIINLKRKDFIDIKFNFK